MALEAPIERQERDPSNHCAFCGNQLRAETQKDSREVNLAFVCVVPGYSWLYAQCNVQPEDVSFWAGKEAARGRSAKSTTVF